MKQEDKINFNLYDVIKYPLVTEKTTRLSEHSQVVFVVAKSATKSDVKKAVKLIYETDPISVKIINVKGKNKRFKGKLGQRSDMKKAYVRLNQDKITEVASGV